MTTIIDTAATDVGAIKARIEVDISGYNEGIEKAKKKTDELGKTGKNAALSLSDISKRMKEAGASADQIAKVNDAFKRSDPKTYADQVKLVRDEMHKLGATAPEIDKIAQGLDAAKKSTEGLGHSSHEAQGSFMALNMALQDVGASSKSIEAINAAIRKSNPEILEQQLANVRHELEELGVGSEAVDEIVERMRELGESTSEVQVEVEALGAAYIALSVAIGATLAKAVETSADFQQSMQNVKSITEAVGADFEALRQNAIKLGAQTKFSASQAADAMAELGQAGFKTKEIIAAMPGVLSLAAAGNVDLATTADIASSILRGFGMQATETSRVVDVLAKSSIDTNADVTDLGMAMKYVAPVAAAMGLSVEEATAAVGELSNAGIKGEQAGTSLRAMLLALASPSKEAAFYMERLGVSIQDSAGNIVPLSNLIGQFTSVWGRLTQVQQADVASTLVGREAASGFIALIEAGTDTLDGYTESLQDAGGTAERVAGTQMDTLKGAVDNMTSSLESVGITVGDTFLPAVRAAVEGITSLLSGFTDLDPAMQKAILAFMAVPPLVAGAVAAYVSLRKAILAVGEALAIVGTTTPVVAAVALALGVVAAGAAYLYGQYNEAKEVTKQFNEAQTELNKTLSESPIDRTVDELNDLRDKTAELNAVLEQRTKLQDKLNSLDAAIKGGEDDPVILHQAAELVGKLDEVDKKLRTMGYDGVEDATARLEDMNKAIDGSVSALFDEQKAEIATLASKKQRIDAAESELATIKKLSSAQKLDQSQKQALINAVNGLKREYPDLLALQDEDGRVRVQNISVIEQQIAVDQEHLKQSTSKKQQEIKNIIAVTEAQRASVEAQIKNYNALLNVMAAVSKSKAPTFADSVEQGRARMSGATPDVMDIVTDTARAQAEAERKRLAAEQAKYADAEREMKKAAASLSSGDFTLGAGVKGAPVDLSAPTKTKTTKPKTDTGKTPAELAAEARKAAYDADLKTIQFQSDFYNLTADAQIKKYNDLKKRHAQFLKESVDDARTLALQLKRLGEDSVQSRFEFASTAIDQEMKRMEDAGKSEKDMANQRLYMWTNVRKKYKQDSDQYKKADEEVRQARKDLAQASAQEERDTYDQRAKLIEKEIRQMEDAGKSDAEITAFRVRKWQELRDKYKSNTEFYAQADEELYNARKDLVDKTVDLTNDLVDAEKDAINKAKQADLDAIEARKDAYVDAQDAKIKAIDDLIAKEAELNTDADYETQLAEKNARIDELGSAVGPEGIAERERTIEERDRMVLEHERDLRKRELESQKNALADEKDAQLDAFEREKSDTESQYDALLESFEAYSGDIQTIEAAIASFRVSEAAGANASILAGLDDFVSQYNAKMTTVMAARAEAQESLDLAEYNANKDAWAAAKASGNTAEMARLAARNAEIRAKYGVEKDTGKLQHFADGGIVQGAAGTAVPVIAHAGEIVLNPQQQAALFDMLAVPRLAAPGPAAPTYITQHIDLGVDEVTLTDKADIATFYDERTRALSRLQAMGVKD